jgi:hypothetical protein
MILQLEARQRRDLDKPRYDVWKKHFSYAINSQRKNRSC